MAAALTLFNERSFAATPVPEIAERAGVGTGTIYRHWKSKEELVNDIYQAWKERFTRVFLVPDRGQPREEFGEFWAGMRAFARQEPDAYLFLETHHHAPYLDERSEELDERSREAAVGMLKRWQEAGAVADSSPFLLGALICGAQHGLRKMTAADLLDMNTDQEAEAEERVWQMLRPLDNLRESPSDKAGDRDAINA